MKAMNYYVWSDGSESGPFTLDQLYAAWTKGALPAGFLWRRGDAKEFRPPDELDHEHAPAHAPSPEIQAPLSAREYLRNVRGESQYQTLRGMLGVATIVIALAGLSIVGSAIAGKPTGIAPGFDRWAVIGACVAIGVVWTILMVGVHQLLVLAVDAVDLLIDQGRRRPNPEH